MIGLLVESTPLSDPIWMKKHMTKFGDGRVEPVYWCEYQYEDLPGYAYDKVLPSWSEAVQECSTDDSCQGFVQVCLQTFIVSPKVFIIQKSECKKLIVERKLFQYATVRPVLAGLLGRGFRPTRGTRFTMMNLNYHTQRELQVHSNLRPNLKFHLVLIKISSFSDSSRLRVIRIEEGTGQPT